MNINIYVLIKSTCYLSVCLRQVDVALEVVRIGSEAIQTKGKQLFPIAKQSTVIYAIASVGCYTSQYQCPGTEKFLA